MQAWSRRLGVPDAVNQQAESSGGPPLPPTPHTPTPPTPPLSWTFPQHTHSQQLGPGGLLSEIALYQVIEHSRFREVLTVGYFPWPF